MSIKKIADSVGVSAATVSSVLNNPDYRCSTPELRDKIWNTAMKMNYVPNEAARRLKTGVAETQKTYCINVLMTRMDAVIRRMFEETQGRGDGLIIIGKCNHQALKKLEQFLNSDKCPTGIYCSNDITAIGMLKCLSKHKNRYFNPSIISSDGIEEAQYTTPMLTTIQVSREEMGKFAMYLLVDRLRGGHRGKVKIELECRLVKRESCMLAEESKWCDYYI